MYLKSNYITCRAYQFKYTHAVSLILNNTRLSQVKQNITIDENLSRKNHIDEVATKISKNIGIVNRLINYLPNSILLTLYDSLVLPYLNCSILTWAVFLNVINYLPYKSEWFVSFRMLATVSIEDHYLQN